jgi:molybdate transport system substrate-binding protein
MVMMHKPLHFFIVVVFTTSLLSAGQIYVAVAANVGYVIEALKEKFTQQYPNTKVEILLGSSGKLTAQVTHGAPFDLFLSADMKYPESLYQTKNALTKPTVYAQGSLVLLSKKPQNFKQDFMLLQSPNIKRIAMANPKTAPYGKATLEVLEQTGLQKSVAHKLVYGESISQTVAYTTTVTDIGFIAKSALFNPKLQHFQQHTHWIGIDTSLHAPINQGMVILKKGENNPEVKAFYDFILSVQAKTILEKYGYRVP